MKTQRVGFPIHLIVVGTALVTALLLIAVFFFRRIISIFEAYHQVFVLGFLAVVFLWAYWVVYALIRRKVEDHDERRAENT